MASMTKILLMVLGLLSSFEAAASAQDMITLATRRGVTQSFFLTRTPENLEAVGLLFPGSGGLIRLRTEDGQTKFSQGNFLVRSRAEFVKQGVVAAILDAPSDQQGGWGMGDEFRLGDEHVTDVSTVIADLEKRFPRVPLFLVGTSRGSISAASLGAKLGQRVAGAVLTSSMFRPAGRKSKEPGPGLSKFDFATIKIPVLIVHHVSDQCEASPYSDAARLSEKFPLISVSGGLSPKSGPCDPFSQHGYFGKESETVEQIVNWMVKKPFKHEIK
jgi:predicted alpha/beta-hydrolase family hydrolase